MKRIKIDMTKSVDRMVKKNKRDVFENQLHTLVDRLKMMEQAQQIVYAMIKLEFDLNRKSLMKTCKTSDEVAIKVLENTLSAIKDDSLSPKQLRKLVKLVSGEEKLKPSMELDKCMSRASDS